MKQVYQWKAAAQAKAESAGQGATPAAEKVKRVEEVEITDPTSSYDRCHFLLNNRGFAGFLFFHYYFISLLSLSISDRLFLY